MSPTTRVAVVTGSNKGIGFAIVKGLCEKKFDGTVYLTARNEQLGKAAVEELGKLGHTVAFHQLDIDDTASIDRFAKYIKEMHGGLDVLVNNAAIAFKAADTTPFAEQAKVTIRVNFTGTLNMCKAFFPLLRAHARVVHVSSRAGLLSNVKSDEIKKRFSDSKATIDDIVKLLNEFVSAAQSNSHQSLGFPNSAYGMSKIGLTAITAIQQRQFDSEASTRPDIIVNALCPGYVDTDMSSHKGHLTPDQGAITPVHLALLPPNVSEPKGDFWAELKPFDWKEATWKI